MGWFVGTAAIVVVALGVIATLDQVGVASDVTQPIVYTVLLTCGAIIAIGVGGSLIKPMQARWERMLTAAEREPASNGLAAYQQGHADAMRVVHGPGYTKSFGSNLGGQVFPSGPGYQRASGESADTEILDDPENYPGGQYM